MKQPWAKGLVQVLLDDQLADGSFVSLSVPRGEKFGEGAKEFRTTFVVSLIAGALADVPGAEAKRVRERAATWLLGQHGPQWSFNYWAREAAEATSQPYPEDWDDTSCAVIALSLVKPEVVTGEVLGHVVTMLTNTEMAEGGPYRTWIVPADADAHWMDVDLAVNANIAYMLGLHGVELENLERLADERIAAGAVSSPYYPGPGPIEYFLSRWYRGEQCERLLAGVLARRKQGRWDGALQTALGVSAVLNLGAAPGELAEAAEWLRGLKEVRAEAFCIDPAVEGTPYVAGARALTAALVLEAVAKYDAAVAAGGSGAAKKERAGDGAGERIAEQVVAGVMVRLESCGPEIGAAAGQLRDRLLGGPAGQQITLLPYLFRKALGERGRSIGDERLVELGQISLYGWMAYTIYDDFLDEEGDPRRLPAANVAMRELVRALAREAERVPGLGALVWPILDRQEAANAWEVTHCRARRQGDLARMPVPDFGDRGALAERSMGHALGCLALTLELEYAADSAEVRALREFFWHFLIARQLGDDAHDWKDDLEHGQVNAVGALLLGAVERRGASAKGLYDRLERAFWERGIGEVHDWMYGELDQARVALRRATMVERPEVLEALMAPIETAAQAAERQREQAAEFLRTYRPE